jgi:hypothetical protein
MEKIVEDASTELITKYGVGGIFLGALALLVHYLLKENARLNAQAIESNKEFTRQLHEHTKEIIDINKSHTDQIIFINKNQDEQIERISKIFTDRIGDLTAAAALERQNSIAGFHKMAEALSVLQITIERIYTLQQSQNNGRGSGRNG